ncbi:hypothetical protein BN1723_002981 [Verticillium longisporum]|uniref:DUF7779 domain-containing protein n=1 Tax=Verticillium longisporum TaxID=100787 RepID=A0A0G4LMM5_VERLO|nr:hypothetical protein BN1723_002981 [Verticillium longisporum]
MEGLGIAANTHLLRALRPTLAKVARTLGECENELSTLQSKVEPAATGLRMRRIGSRALQWPFKKKDVDAMVQNFERYQRVITDALQMDQARLIQRNTRLMEQMTLQKAPEKPPSPDLPAACFTIPFPRDPEFVDRPTLCNYWKTNTKALDNVYPSLAWAVLAYLPKTGDGKIQVTTRSMNAAEKLTGGHHSVIQIPTMGQAECLQLVHTNATFVYEKTAAEKLVQILELIPLAVTQAVAYINRRAPRVSIQSYIQSFRKNEAWQGNLLTKDSGDVRRLDSASNSIVVTWQITFEQIRQESPSSAELLSLMSFFHSQNIPEELLQGYLGLSPRSKHDLSQREWSSQDNQLPDQPEANSDVQLQRDLDALMGYSLIAPTTTKGFYDMHALVQFCTQEWLAKFDEPERWRKQFIRLAAINFPDGELGNWERCQALLPHSQKLVDREAPDSESSIDRARLMHNMAWYMLKIGKASRALRLIGTALSLRKRILDKEHDDIRWSLRVLGILYTMTGQLVKAEETFAYLLETTKRRHGEQSNAALAITNDLVSMYVQQGRIDEAEKLGAHTIEMARHVFGESGTLTLIMERQMANIYCEQERYDLAEALLDRNSNIMWILQDLTGPAFKDQDQDQDQD